MEYNFKEHLSWNDITTGVNSFRYFENGFLFDAASAVAFVPEHIKYYLLGYLNTNFVNYLSKLLNPTIHFKLGDYEKLPFKEWTNKKIEELAQENVDICKVDWDSFETSWDFQQHPLIRCASFSRQEMETDAKKHIQDMNYIKDAFTRWSNECYLRFTQLKSNEEELNRIFIDIYGLQEELTPEVEDKDITVRKADLQRDIKSLISYAVGCMFGRYSFDKEGLIFAGGRMEDKFSYYGGNSCRHTGLSV